MRRTLSTFVIGAMALSVPSYAAVYTWDGEGANNNLGTAANWFNTTAGTNDNVAFGDHDYVFNVDGGKPTINNETARQLGQMKFTGDAFTFTGLSINNENGDARAGILMDTANPITFNNLVTLRRGITGTGTGTLTFADISFVSRDNTWNGAGVIVINAANPGTGNGSNRTLTLGGTQKVIVNSTTNGLSRSNVIVQSGAVLGGAGFITPGDTSKADVTIQSGGRLSPGDNYTAAADVGTLTFGFINTSGTPGRLILNTGSLFTFDLATVAASDKIDITAGGLTLNGQQFSDFTFNALSGFGAGTYTLFQSVNTTGSLGANLTGTIAGLDAELSLSGHNVILNVVPEPASVGLLALASLGLLRRRRGA